MRQLHSLFQSLNSSADCCRRQTNLLNADLMESMRIIATVFQVLWLHVASVHCAVYPTTRPTCDHLEITPCKIHHSVDSKGNYDLRYYYEECFFHKCTLMNPLKPPPPPPLSKWKSPPPALKVADGFTNKTAREPPPKPPPPVNEGPLHQRQVLKYTDPELVGEDSEGRFVRSDSGKFGDFWFCAGGGKTNPLVYGEQLSGVNYYARVITNAPRPPGQTEDLRAHCEWLKFRSLLQISACETYNCNNQCMTSMRIFLCAKLFPRCEPASGHPFGPGINHPKLNNSGGVIYGPANITDDIGASFTLIKPCRAVCWDIYRKCQVNSKIECHLRESRDWSDPPHCEYLDYPDAKNLYI